MMVQDVIFGENDVVMWQEARQYQGGRHRAC